MKTSAIHVASVLLLGMLLPVCRAQDKPKPEEKPKGEVSTTPVKALIVFTEYKETLFYLEHRFLQEGFDKNTLRLLYGGMTVDEFEQVKGEFGPCFLPGKPQSV